MAQVNIAIIGLGRLGASFGLALKALHGKPENKHQFTIVGNDTSNTRLKAASKLGAMDREAKNADQAVENADLVIIATRYGLVKDVMEAIGPALKPGAVVVDTSPLKQPSIAWADKYFPRDKEGALQAYLVGITPMVNPDYLGNPGEGTEDARADLFENGQIVISPAPACPPEAVRLVSDLTQLLGLKAHFSDPIEHDAMAAAMDGLPLLVQLGVFQSLTHAPGWDDTQWFGNPAFFLATYRLGAEDPESLAAALHKNRTNMLTKLDKLIATLNELRDVLHMEDAALLEESFDTAIRQYAAWQRARSDNMFSTELPDLAPMPSTGFGFGMFPSFGGGQRNKKKKEGRG